MVDDILLAEGLKELLDGLVELELRVNKIEKQRKKNTHLLKQILIAYHGRGHSTFKCRQIAQLSGMSSSAIGKFYINQFIQMGMIHIYGKTAKGYRYMFNSEWFDNGNEM